MPPKSDDNKEFRAAPRDISTSQMAKLGPLLPKEDEAPQGGSKLDLVFQHWLPGVLEKQKHLVKVIKCIYLWNFTRGGQIVSVWTFDLKNGDGSIYPGNPKNEKPDCAITIDEKDAIDMFEGKFDAAKAFMSGKFKITGNIMAAHKFQQFYADELGKGNVRSITEILQEIERGGTGSAPIMSTIEPARDDTALLEMIPVTGIKSDLIFSMINKRMHEQPELVKAFRVIIQMNITKGGKPAAVWTIDTKTPGGEIYRSEAKSKPDATITIDDENLILLLFEKLNPQRAFMTGKFRVTGNILLLQKVESLVQSMKGTHMHIIPEYKLAENILLNDPLIPGLRSEAMIFEILQRLVRLPKLCHISTVFEIDVLKNGQNVSVWTLSFSPASEFGELSRGKPKTGSANCVLTLDDDDFVRLSYNTLKLDDAIAKGRVKVSGNNSLIPTLNKIFTTPTMRAKL